MLNSDEENYISADSAEMSFRAQRGIYVFRFFGLRPQNDCIAVICENLRNLRINQVFVFVLLPPFPCLIVTLKIC